MTQFSFDTNTEANDKIAAAPESVKTRIRALENEARKTNAARSARRDEISDINGRLEDLSRILHAARKEVSKSGPYRTETSTLDPKTGGVEVTVKQTNYIEKIEAEIAALKATRSELIDKKSGRVWIEQVREDLGKAGTRPLIVAEPIDWNPNKKEISIDGYKREFAYLADLVKNQTVVWNAGRTLPEMEKTVCAEIDLLAAQGTPGFGGHNRGSSYGRRGLQVQTTPRIDWPRERLGLDALEADNAKALIAWLFRDQMNAAAIKEIRATFSDEGAISAAAKPAMLAGWATKIWHQRRVVEAAYIFCIADGVARLNRPRDTPTEILIDVLPWKGGVEVEPMKADAIEGDAIEFEQDDNADE